MRAPSTRDTNRDTKPAAPSTPAPSEVLVVACYGARDGVLPMGLVQAVNQLSAPKRGALYLELSPAMLVGVKVVVLQLHWDVNFRYFPALVRFVRKHARGAAIVVGGYLSTVHARRLLRDYRIDYCIVRDYERPFKELIEALLAGRDARWILENVPNLVGRDGASRTSFKMRPAMLSELDGSTLDWFPTLKKYVRFQDVLNELGDAKWSEEQYFPAIVIKGTFNRMCSYCALSNQNFQKFCTQDNYCYLDEEDFVRQLDAYVGWRGVNVFGDFCGLDLDKLLRLLEGRSYAFELTLGDLFRRIDDDKLLALASHFKKVWAIFSVLPLSCYLGRKKITLSLFEVERDRALFEKLAQRERDDLSVAFWINTANMMPGEDFSMYSGRTRRIDPWLPYPTQEPTEEDYEALRTRSRAYERKDRAVRFVSVHLRPRKAKTVPSAIEIVSEPFTMEPSTVELDPSRRRERDTFFRESTPASRVDLGVHEVQFDVTVSRGGLELEGILFERDLHRTWKLRYFTIRFPRGARRRYMIELRVGLNLAIARIFDEDGRIAKEDVVVFTMNDVRLGLDPDIFRRTEAAYAELSPKLVEG